MPEVSIRSDWKPEDKGCCDKCLSFLLKIGPVPRHVAFIMDGNRRYARRAEREQTFGHSQGFHKLESVVEWCSNIGVKAVTVYAFSIENFKRATNEVSYLFDLARGKAQELLEHRHLLERHRIRIIFSGNLQLVPHDVRQLCMEIMRLTKDNESFICIICLAYTSSSEIADAATNIMSALRSSRLDDADLQNPTLIDACLMPPDVPPIDILIRTSGETRLSDFMLWQTAFSMMAFVDVLWPDFSFWDFAKIVYRYKWVAGTLKNLETQYRERIYKTTSAETLSPTQKRIVEDRFSLD